MNHDPTMLYAVQNKKICPCSKIIILEVSTQSFHFTVYTLLPSIIYNPNGSVA